MASAISALISGVSLGIATMMRAPVRRAPHQISAACAIPAATTAQLAAVAESTAERAGITAIRMAALSRIGAAAEKMNRPRALSTPDSRAVIAMQGR